MQGLCLDLPTGEDNPWRVHTPAEPESRSEGVYAARQGSREYASISHRLDAAHVRDESHRELPSGAQG